MPIDYTSCSLPSLPDATLPCPATPFIGLSRFLSLTFVDGNLLVKSSLVHSFCSQCPAFSPRLTKRFFLLSFFRPLSTVCACAGKPRMYAFAVCSDLMEFCVTLCLFWSLISLFLAVCVFDNKGSNEATLLQQENEEKILKTEYPFHLPMPTSSSSGSQQHGDGPKGADDNGNRAAAHTVQQSAGVCARFSTRSLLVQQWVVVSTPSPESLLPPLSTRNGMLLVCRWHALLPVASYPASAMEPVSASLPDLRLSHSSSRKGGGM